jgi:hypothetical protein
VHLPFRKTDKRCFYNAVGDDHHIPIFLSLKHGHGVEEAPDGFEEV